MICAGQNEDLQIYLCRPGVPLGQISRSWGELVKKKLSYVTRPVAGNLI